jgi:hypothetical protein
LELRSISSRWLPKEDVEPFLDDEDDDEVDEDEIVVKKKPAPAKIKAAVAKRIAPKKGKK